MGQIISNSLFHAVSFLKEMYEDYSDRTIYARSILLEVLDEEYNK